MSENVSIDWKTGNAANDRHIGRYRRCLHELIKELENVPEAKAVLDKYSAATLEDFKVSLNLPGDFDQATLPEELR
jgi:hypothetical protein